MMLPYLLAAAVLAAPVATSDGVKVTEVPRIAVATSFATCIARESGALPASGQGDVVREAAGTCRDRLDRDFANGNFTMDGKPFPKSWWKANGLLFDDVTADAATFAATAPQGARLTALWRNADGTLVRTDTAVFARGRDIVFAVEGSVG